VNGSKHCPNLICSDFLGLLVSSQNILNLPYFQKDLLIVFCHSVVQAGVKTSVCTILALISLFNFDVLRGLAPVKVLPRMFIPVSLHIYLNIA
jgi:hypothetical protein